MGLSVLLVPAVAWGQGVLAEGFSRLPQDVRVIVMPADVELFEVSAGGVLEPRADWTAAAGARLVEGLRQRLGAVPFDDDGDARIAALARLHTAVSRAISVHHFGGLTLPGKEGRLDWTLGSDAQVLKRRTGADYALFAWVRDSYASDGRKAAIMLGVLFAAVMPGGTQQAHASLVELETGRIVWFNRVSRAAGDLRDPELARESLDALLEGFPR
jgi:hypothetical protein